MGILEKSGFKVKSLGLLDENGKSVDDGPFIETQLEIMDAEGNTKCSVSLTGDARYNCVAASRGNTMARHTILLVPI